MAELSSLYASLGHWQGTGAQAHQVNNYFKVRYRRVPCSEAIRGKHIVLVGHKKVFSIWIADRLYCDFQMQCLLRRDSELNVLKQ